MTKRVIMPGGSVITFGRRLNKADKKRLKKQIQQEKLRAALARSGNKV